MTLGELFNNTNIEGNVKVQCWEDESPTVYYEDFSCGCALPKDLAEYEDREVAYIFPYTFYHKNVLLGGICIELATEE